MTETKVLKLGKCFEKNGEQMLTGMDDFWYLGSEIDDVRLCHGVAECTGEGMKGVRFVHCWLEVYGGLVIDVSKGEPVIISKDAYYNAGTIDRSTVVRYTHSEMLDHITATGHWGPWASHLEAMYDQELEEIQARGYVVERGDDE